MSITAKIAATVAGSVLVLSAAVVPAAASSSSTAADAAAGTAAGPVQGAWLTGLPGTAAKVAGDVYCC
ncbi:hypothetical protein AB0H07_30250 [Streptomyces sp. NPDC021354]|uniref:hypothetical protein n=1 Tax=unclassified Streptomyces TaxID=2593676 RepID=UPI0034093473